MNFHHTKWPIILVVASAMLLLPFTVPERVDANNETLMALHHRDSFFPCNLVPSPVHEKACLMSLKWNQRVKELEKTNGFRHDLPSPSAALVMNPHRLTLAQAADFYGCMNLQCLCPLMDGNWNESKCVLKDGTTLKKAVRKEYRMLTVEERQKLHNAFHDIKYGALRAFDEFANQHTPDYAPGAHGGPAFLGWHREFLKRMEIALRRTSPHVALAYWDSSLDQPLEDPRDSVLWTDEFFGSHDEHGFIKDGPFKNWTTSDGFPVDRGLSPLNSLIKAEDVRFLKSSDKVVFYGLALCARECAQRNEEGNEQENVGLENIHGHVHIFVGGKMENPFTAPSDPCFYFHHAFIDAIWEEWRHARETSGQREHGFPDAGEIKCCKIPSAHLLKNDMLPFSKTTGNLTNEHGLSNEYTHKETGLFEYAPRPTCSGTEGCGSDYLFCWEDLGISRCVSKIRPGGKCAKFADNVDNPCYNGECVNGMCDKSGLKPGLGISNSCEDKHECCFLWAEAGECEKKPRYMNIWCPGSCRYNLCMRGDFAWSLDIDKYCNDIRSYCLHWTNVNPDECRANPMWMAHNCRRSCNKCHIPRREACSGVKPKDF